MKLATIIWQLLGWLFCKEDWKLIELTWAVYERLLIQVDFRATAVLLFPYDSVPSQMETDRNKTTRNNELQSLATAVVSVERLYETAPRSFGEECRITWQSLPQILTMHDSKEWQVYPKALWWTACWEPFCMSWICGLHIRTLMDGLRGFGDICTPLWHWAPAVANGS